MTISLYETTQRRHNASRQSNEILSRNARTSSARVGPRRPRPEWPFTGKSSRFNEIFLSLKIRALLPFRPEPPYAGEGGMWSRAGSPPIIGCRDSGLRTCAFESCPRRQAQQVRERPMVAVTENAGLTNRRLGCAQARRGCHQGQQEGQYAENPACQRRGACRGTTRTIPHKRRPKHSRSALRKELRRLLGRVLSCCNESRPWCWVAAGKAEG